MATRDCETPPPFGEGVVGVPLLLPSRLAAALEREASRRGMTAAALMRLLLGSSERQAGGEASLPADQGKGAAVAEVLVIDDNPHIRRIVRAMLEAEGHSVREAGGGDEGLRLYDESPADVVLCDLFMPGGDGLTAIRALRERSPRARLVAMSGGAELVPGDFLRVARMAGACGSLAKPFSRAELLAAVGEALAG